MAMLLFLWLLAWGDWVYDLHGGRRRGISIAHAAEATSLASLSRDGTLPQIIFAERAIARSEPSLGVITRDNGALIATLRPRRRTLKLSDESKLELIDNKIAVCISGYKPDCEFVKKKILSIVESHRLLFGESISLHGLGHELSSWFAHQLTPGSDKMLARPLVVCVILASASSAHKRCPELVTVRNSGSCVRCKSIILGNWSDSVDLTNAMFQSTHDAGSSRKTLRKLIHLLSRSGYSDRTLEYVAYNVSNTAAPWRKLSVRIPSRVKDKNL
jgi:20S proteasome alpha/beta subunit